MGEGPLPACPGSREGCSRGWVTRLLPTVLDVQLWWVPLASYLRAKATAAFPGICPPLFVLLQGRRGQNGLMGICPFLFFPAVPLPGL